MPTSHTKPAPSGEYAAGKVDARSASEPIEAVRAIRDDIQARVTTLLSQVLRQS